MVNTFQRFLVLCVLSSFALSSALSAERVLLDGIAAKVNDEIVTIWDVLVRVQPFVRTLSSQYSADALHEKMMEAYREELNALIERQLIFDAYEKQEGRIQDWAVDQRINEIIHEKFADDRDALMNVLANDQRTYEEWKEDIRKQLIVASMQQNAIQRRVSVSATDVYEVYKRNPEKYRLPDEVRLSMIVLKKPPDEQGATDVLDKAKDLRRQLFEGADFAEFARLYSQGAKAEAGGAWSWTRIGDLTEELKEVMNALPEGQISEVIDTDKDVYLTRVEERRGGETPAFNDVRQEIEKDLKRAEADRLYKHWMTTLKKDAYIKIFDVNPFEN